MARVDIGLLIAGLALAVVVAVPRHTGLASEARRTEVSALARNAASAVQLAHRQWEAAGRPATLPGGRGTVAMVHGYPSAATLPLLLAEPELAPFAYERGTFQHGQASGPCGLNYLPPAAVGAAPVFNLLTAGC